MKQLSLEQSKFYNDEFRCFSCGKLLGRDKHHTSFEIKCVRCGTVNTLFKHIKDQVVVTDEEGIILYANMAVEEATGYSLAEILGNKPSVWGGLMPKDFYKKLWRKLKMQKGPVVVKVNNKRKDGTTYGAMLRITPISDTKGDIKFYIGMETTIE